MPFTLSHPAAVIPLRRLGVFSALITGSMMPDSLYFMPFGSTHESYGHTLAGLFLYCLPVGIAFLWIYHSFLKLPFIAFFPPRQQGKLLAVAQGFRFAPLPRFVAIAASVLVGAATHVTWDAFTHQSGWGAQLFPALREPVIIPPHFGFYLTELLQLASSAFGLAVILISYWRWQRTAEGVPAKVHLPAFARATLLIIFCGVAIAPAVARFSTNPEFWSHAKRQWLGLSVVDGIKIACLEMLVFSVIWHLAFGDRQIDATPESHSSSL
jgi:hypothetical protein